MSVIRYRWLRATLAVAVLAGPQLVASGAPAAAGAMVRTAAQPAAAEVDTPAAMAPVGQLFVNGGNNACTASVVSSRSGRIAMTAAHCVYLPPVTERLIDIGIGREPGWIDGLAFVPARAGDDAPYGIWAAERVWVDKAWQEASAPELDVAFLQLSDSPSGTAQEVLGSLGVRFATDTSVTAASGPDVDVLGYPAEGSFDGTGLRRCPDSATDARYVDLYEARCDLTRGSSGGPWVVPEDAGWTAVALTSYLSVPPGSLGGVRLGAMAEALWLGADEAAMAAAGLSSTRSSSGVAAR